MLNDAAASVELKKEANAAMEITTSCLAALWPCCGFYEPHC